MWLFNRMTAWWAREDDEEEDRLKREEEEEKKRQVELQRQLEQEREDKRKREDERRRQLERQRQAERRRQHEQELQHHLGRDRQGGMKLQAEHQRLLDTIAFGEGSPYQLRSQALAAAVLLAALLGEACGSCRRGRWEFRRKPPALALGPVRRPFQAFRQCGVLVPGSAVYLLLSQVFGALKVGAFKVRPLKFGAIKVGALKVGPFKVHSQEPSVFEVRPFEAGPFKVRPDELGALKIRS